MPSSRPLPGVLMLVPAGSEGEAVYNAPVAQPDRVVASEAIGRGFESLRARHLPLLPSALADPPPSRMPPAHPGSQSVTAKRFSRRHSAMADRQRASARASHSSPCSARTSESLSTRYMLNNCVASRDQLPSSQRHVHLGQLPLQVVDTAAIAREVSIQQLPARAIPPGSGFPSQ